MHSNCAHIRDSRDGYNQIVELQFARNNFWIEPITRPTSPVLFDFPLCLIRQQRGGGIQNVNAVPNAAEEGVFKVYQVDSDVLRVSNFSIASFVFDTDDFHDWINDFSSFIIAKL